jgi:sigma-B regulation protein RsbU (phosphoserine phosphatase)
MLPHKEFHHKKAALPSNEDILYARSIQGMLAPTDEELNDLFQNLAVYDKPLGFLSGDFLFARKKKDLTFLAVCDCTGHGMSAALMTVLAREKLSHAFDKSIGPAHLLTRLDEKFRRSILRGDKGRLMRAGAGMDLAVIALNHDRRSLRFAGARRPLWIVRNGELLEYKGTPRSIGGNYWRDDVFVETTIAVKPDDLVYIFTDGLSDQFGGAKDKKLMTSGLRKLILEASELPIKDQASFISYRMYNWQSNYESTDDQMLAVIKI